MEFFANPELWVAFLSLLLLEIVLGIDNVVFSLDSVITVVGMVDELYIMIAAVMIAIGIMLLSAGYISDFVNKHPTVKMLALSFLLIIGASLVAEGFDAGLSKGYIYGPIAFAILVEVLNLRYQAVSQRRRKARHPEEAPVEPLYLRPAYVKSGEQGVTLPHAKRPPRP